MQWLKSAWSLLLGLALLAVLGYAVVWASAHAVRTLANLNPNVGAALITGALAFLGLLYVQRQNKAKDIAEAHRAEKVKVYRQFMDFVSGILGNADEIKSKSAEEIATPEFKKQFVTFTSDLIVWASPGVLKKFAAWRVSASSPEPRDMLLAVDDLLQAIRKDLRNSNFGLKRGDLMSMYLRDPSEMDRRLKE